MREPSHIDLFSGQGGFALAAEWAGFQTVAFCEIDEYCQKILEKNFGAVIPDANAFGRNGRAHNEGKAPAGRARPKIVGDIRDFDGREYRGCDLLTGGFPCQPFSVAGKRRGTADDRNLWPEMLRVIKESQPTWVIGENVPGIETMEFRRITTRVEDHASLVDDNEEVHIYCESTLVLDACVRDDLESLGYEVQPLCIPACGVDARHRRDRIWIVAHSEHNGSLAVQSRLGAQGTTEGKNVALQSQGQGSFSNSKGERLQRLRTGRQQEPRSHAESKLPLCGSEKLADTGEQSFEGRSARTRRRRGEYEEASQVGRGKRRQSDVVWLPEPDVGRVAHGVPFRVDRLKALGNAIVPEVAYEIIYEIGELIHGELSIL